ncbi:hypothetical protein COP2_024521 [Malus domestica]
MRAQTCNWQTLHQPDGLEFQQHIDGKESPNGLNGEQLRHLPLHWRNGEQRRCTASPHQSPPPQLRLFFFFVKSETAASMDVLLDDAKSSKVLVRRRAERIGSSEETITMDSAPSPADLAPQLSCGLSSPLAAMSIWATL